MSSFFRSVSDSDDSSSDEEEELSSSGEDSGIEGKVTKTPKSKKAAKGSDSDDSDDDSDDSDSDSEEEKKEEGPKPTGRFLRGPAAADSDDSDDERSKVVKSAKTKRIEEVEASCKSIDNAAKINDWSALTNGTSFIPYIKQMSLHQILIGSLMCTPQNSTNLSD